MPLALLATVLLYSGVSEASGVAAVAGCTELGVTVVLRNYSAITDGRSLLHGQIVALLSGMTTSR